MRFLTFLLLQVTADHDIEKLVRAAEFDIGFDHDRVPALHDRILHFVRTDRLRFVHALAEVLALQHLLKSDTAVEPDDVGEGHAGEPLAIEHNLRLRPVEHLESLILVGLGVGQHFIVGQLRARGRTTAWVTDHCGKIADDKDPLMPEILELTQLLQSDGVAEVDVGGSRIDAEFDTQRATRSEFLLQLLAADDLRATAGEKFRRLVGTHALNGCG